MWNIYQAFSEAYDIKKYSAFFLYDDINIKFMPFKALPSTSQSYEPSNVTIDKNIQIIWLSIIKMDGIL